MAITGVAVRRANMTPHKQGELVRAARRPHDVGDETDRKLFDQFLQLVRPSGTAKTDKQ